MIEYIEAKSTNKYDGSKAAKLMKKENSNI